MEPPALDPAIHQPARLKILMLLAATPVAGFNELAKDAGLTSGNLLAHLRALEAVGYVEASRGIVNLRPRMRYHLTDQGRAALRAYCDALETVLSGIRQAVGEP